MQFISPFNNEDTARTVGRQAMGPLIDAIRCTIADIIKDSEDAHTRLLMLSSKDTPEPVEIDTVATIQAEHADLLVNIVIALDEHRQHRGQQAVHDWITGTDTTEDTDTDTTTTETTKEARIAALERLIVDAQVDLYKLRSDDGGPDNG